METVWWKIYEITEMISWVSILQDWNIAPIRILFNYCNGLRVFVYASFSPLCSIGTMWRQRSGSALARFSNYSFIPRGPMSCMIYVDRTNTLFSKAILTVQAIFVCSLEELYEQWFIYWIIICLRHINCYSNSGGFHYNDVIMGPMASQITSLTIVYSAVYSGAD